MARKAAEQVKGCPQLQVVTAKERPEGWTGKVWALHQGVEAASGEEHEYFWFTDADILHSPDVLTGLVARAEGEGLDLVSVMARLHVSTFWDRILIPAFVFFFGKLYPFRWVNDHGRGTAAAAGGCMLVRKDRFIEAGGFEAMRDAVIDDCALAQAGARAKGGGEPVAGDEPGGAKHPAIRRAERYMGHGGQDGIRPTAAFAGGLGGNGSGDGLALSRWSGGGGSRDRVVGGRGWGCGDLGDAGGGGGGVGVDGRAVRADVEVVRSRQMLGAAAPGFGGAVHTDDGGLGMEEPEGSGWGVEGEDLLRSRPGMEQRDG